MLCLTCHRPVRGQLCHECTSTLRRASDHVLTGGLRLVAAFEHDGVARRLVHLLKYQGVDRYARVVAVLLAPRLPDLPLTPIPRALSRRIRYGVDPALVIARELSALTGQPLARVLSAPLHARRRAGGDHGRPVAAFRPRATTRTPVILIDDVVTTGATILSGVRALGPERVALAAAANVVAEVTSLPRYQSS